MRTCAAAVTMAAALLTGCNAGPPPAGPPVCTVSGVGVVASPTTVSVGVASNLTAALNATPSCPTGLTWTAAPAGGTLTSSGATATFSAAAPGVFTIRAASVADPNVSGTATVTVAAAGPPPCGQPNGTTVTHAANIGASETWAGDGVTHVVPSSISLTGSAIVTIAPCAIVALGPGAFITVREDARLVAAGTSASRFVVVRRNDPAQAWGQLRSLTPTSRIDLSWTRVEGGGGSGGQNDAAVYVFGSGYGALPTAVLRVDNVTITGSRSAGVHLDTNATFTPDSRDLQITGSAGRPILATLMSIGSIPTGSYTGNAVDEILVTPLNSRIFADMTVEDRGIPVRIPFSGRISVGPDVGSTTPVTLTLRPGVVFRFARAGNQPGAQLTFGTNGAAPNNLVGVLNAVGTAARPIVFTSGEAVPAPGDWTGIWLNTANGSRLDFVEISYAGAPNGIQSNNCRPANTEDQGALLVGSFSAQYVPPTNMITNSRITNSGGFGINAMWLAPTFNAPDLTASNTFQNNTRCRQTYNGILPPGTCPVSGGCTAN